MFPLSISEFSTKNWSLFQDLIQTTKRNLGGIGIWRAKAEDEGIEQAIELIHEMESPISSLSWIGGFTGSDGRSHIDAIKDGIETIHFARQIDAACVVVHSGGQNNHTDQHSRRLVRTAMKELVEVAADLDIRLALEPMTGHSCTNWSIFKSFDEVHEMVEEFPVETVGMVLDLFYHGTDEKIYRRLPELIQRIALVQIADRNPTVDLSFEEDRLLPGQGQLPIEKWLTRLVHCGYTGHCELEVHGQQLESLGYSEIVERSQQTMARMLDRARSRSKNKLSSR